MSLQFTHPLLYLITDRRKIPRTTTDTQLEALLTFVDRAMAAGVDLVQIREPDLSGHEQFSLTERIAALAGGRRTKVLINDRADIAAAGQGTGVHLTTRSLRVAVVRKTFGDDLLIGASTHTLAEAREAEDGGANFVVFGPVFETESKRIYGKPVGVAALRQVTGNLRIPVLAIGGIKLTNYRQVREAGAQGIAAISLFTETEDLHRLVRNLKKGEEWSY